MTKLEKARLIVELADRMDSIIEALDDIQLANDRMQELLIDQANRTKTLLEWSYIRASVDNISYQIKGIVYPDLEALL